MFQFNFNHLWLINGQLIHVNRNQDLTYMGVLFKCLADAAQARLTRLILRERELYAGEPIHALDESRPCLQHGALRRDAMGDTPQRASIC
ncbi:hypothetical protein MRY17_11985 [Pseudomonas orientalis]|uniref:hypothetical protein n=1 Tax=Pseudomonas orientalis TaxID=76758 RepID=UPI001FB02238|nr:hypothetical protein [Pseudomonas orientalis]MDF2796563.1 ArsR family transcriptional regulator [Pseudomonas orientalis]UOB26383.1 hypothetical protein MRY17_11985 [Pseudomonas orientalis]